jgi:hypothetical protein
MKTAQFSQCHWRNQQKIPHSQISQELFSTLRRFEDISLQRSYLPTPIEEKKIKNLKGESPSKKFSHFSVYSC